MVILYIIFYIWQNYQDLIKKIQIDYLVLKLSISFGLEIIIDVIEFIQSAQDFRYFLMK